MLRLLRVRNFALIEELTLEFDSGLNVLSGETGAGKSLIVDALSLLAGARASDLVIRSGEDRATVEAVLDTPKGLDTSHLGLDAGDNDELILRREIASDNRNRVFIDHQPATVAALREIASALFDIHGQHQQQTLLESAAQLEFVDRSGGTQPLRDRVGTLHGEIGDLRRELDRLATSEAELLQRRDLLEFQHQEIAAIHPEANESSRLRDEVRVLENAGRLLEAAGSGYETLYESESSILGRLASIQRVLETEADHDPRLGTIAEQIRAGRTTLEDAAFGLRDYLDRIEIDPARTERLQSRLAELERLERKYGPDLVAHLEKVRQELDNLGLEEDRKSSVLEQLERLDGELQRLSEELSQNRRSAAAGLARKVTREVRTLAMPQARFSIRWETLPSPGPTGIDRTVWDLAPNPGEDAALLASIASGGELSRVMLALRTVLTADGQAHTLIFDEIDAGIGGEAAEQVGRKLRDLARSYQVLCVTHLPQIARFADRHLRIGKSVSQGRTRTRIEHLDPEARVDELARMMSGGRVTEAARRHVRELLKNG